VPELPEVEVTRRALEPLVVGRRILALRQRDPARYRGTELAQGRRVEAIRRRGKFLLFALSGGFELIVHLGMTGGFRLKPSEHTRVVLELAGVTLYYHDPRRLGRFWVVPAGDYRQVPLLLRMGPEPFDPAFSPEYLYARLRSTRRPVKAVLLDQEVVAGIGNIYGDEALFRAQVRPTRRGHRVARREAGAIVEGVRAVLAEAIVAGGSTLKDQSYQRLDGTMGYFQLRLSVYGRAGEPCPTCGTPIRRVTIQGRSAHYCSRCQR